MWDPARPQHGGFRSNCGPISPGSDIIMQLDDVVSSTVTGPRVEEAMYRYVCVQGCVCVCVCVGGGPPGPAAYFPCPSPGL